VIGKKEKFMEIDIRMPSYFKQHYKVDEEIIKMCSEITEKMDQRNHSNVIKKMI
jgi:hypothetical protein